MTNHKIKIVISAVCLITFITILFYFYHAWKLYPSTDNAYVQANSISVSAQVTGPVENIFVVDHQFVKEDQLLFTIEKAPFDIRVKQMRADVEVKKAQLTYAERNAARYLHLVQIGQESKSLGDQYQSQLETARASLQEANAKLAQALLDLEHTNVLAPRSGIITQFTLRPGLDVLANTPLFKLVEQNLFWVDANFKETQLERIRKKQPATIELDMYPGRIFHGYVEAISAASGVVFSLLPPENASGNWVKVTQRFPVKVIITDNDQAFPLRAGATATVKIDTRKLLSD
jgi:membrane fusion protein (multidrug efflux system)